MKKEELEEFLKKCIEKGFETSVNIKDIRAILITDFDKGFLMYPFAKHWIKSFIETLEYNEFGKYDGISQIFHFNQDNPFYIDLVLKKVKSERS
jgi:hypothetical protein